MFAIEIEVRYTVQINKALSLLHHGGPCLEWNNLDWPKIIQCDGIVLVMVTFKV